MRTCTLLVVALIFGAACVSLADDPMPQFMDYIKKFNKSYKDSDEFNMRYENFKSSLTRTAARSNNATFGLTKFSDMSIAEFKRTYLGYVPNPHRNMSNVVVERPVEKVAKGIVDWRKKGAVTPVKNQAQCGSCWAFSATEEIESMNILKTGKTEILSPEQITQCTTTAYGCNGGDTTLAYAYVEKAGGITTNAKYPYTSGTGVTGKCHFKESEEVVKISGYTFAVPECTSGSCRNQDIEGLNSIMAKKGPVSICVDAESWQDYTGGVLSSDCPSDALDLDHCVQLVGSNTEAEKPYWIVRNSWATDWGIDGYIYVAMKDNLCGIADEATFATIA